MNPNFKPNRRNVLVASSLFAMNLVAKSAFAQRPAWPDKPIRLVIPFASGGTADLVARLLANVLSERLGQPVVVDAKAGANGIIGADAVAKAAPDGATLLLHSSAHAINASLYKKLPYDTERAFTAVAPVVAPGVFVIAVHPSLPARNLRELIDYARVHPDTVSYGSAGIGNGLHLAGEMLAQAAGIRLLHVPYKGAAPIVNDLVGGQIKMMFNSPLAVQSFVKEGKLRLIAQTGLKRSAALPDLPTVSESGLPGYEATSWYGLYAPAGTPADIVARLNAETLRAMNLPEVMDKLAVLGTGALAPTSPAQFAAFTHGEIERYARVIRAAQLSLDS
ncbi:tripartite tricarboxylate transporter substrate binding protein [Variovorax terrae]|uniref:Tripartite tricarboxylate transporter substrate binding protein n=1 Tax=Variovorax terrae TaxID=2923278 RepID=A0A9X1VZ50_9BURK|nr:tripartite tricarboxylate transporter substrate binding protein [Variovorax terrae]MCJ0765564.1 tripartite tricarboxylate transporter substrate binding protein [Variovorax terrae]